LTAAEQPVLLKAAASAAFLIQASTESGRQRRDIAARRTLPE